MGGRVIDFILKGDKRMESNDEAAARQRSGSRKGAANGAKYGQEGKERTDRPAVPPFLPSEIPEIRH